MEYSVLMSVYTKEEPAYLDTAIQSMLDQTVRTDDFGSQEAGGAARKNTHGKSPVACIASFL